MKKTILLFAGGDRELHQDLQKHFNGPASEWQATLVQSRTEALSAMAIAPYDAIIAEVDLPGLNGAQLLDEVMRLYPKTLRFILSELSASQATMTCVGTAHQFLLKPTDAQTVKCALERAFALETWLPSDAVQSLMSSIRKLPSPPNLYFKVVKALESPLSSVETVGGLIAEDVVMSAKLLQLVNSAVFGLQLQVAHAGEAVAYLGVETTKSLILLAHTFSYFDEVRASGFSIDQLWRHSLATGHYAHRIADAESVDPEMINQAFTAGMLHDIGKLILAANLPAKFSKVVALARQQKVELWQVERELFGATHAEVGACLLGIWGLPLPIVEATALHHHPAQLLSKTFCPLTAVHVANALEHAAQRKDFDATLVVDGVYLEELGLTGRLEEWQQVCEAQSVKQ
ncbi:MAG: response regulator [Verrucomicrobiota bacterium]